jgi:hypothetical protein
MKSIIRIAMFFGVFAIFPTAVLDISSAESSSLFSGRSYDFGVVKEGAKVIHVFTVRNETEAPLRDSIPLFLLEAKEASQWSGTRPTGKGR